MIAILLTLVSVLANVVGYVARPTIARCPAPLWLATGVQPDGRFGCWLDAPDDPATTTLMQGRSVGVVWGRVWCGAGERAVQVGDGRGVRCAGVRGG